MSASGIPGGVPDLGAPRAVPIREVRLLHLAGFNLKPGGLDQGLAVAHVQVVDIPNGIAYLIPLDGRAVSCLADQLAELTAD